MQKVGLRIGALERLLYLKGKGGNGRGFDSPAASKPQPLTYAIGHGRATITRALRQLIMLILSYAAVTVFAIFQTRPRGVIDSGGQVPHRVGQARLALAIKLAGGRRLFCLSPFQPRRYIAGGNPSSYC